MSQPVDSRHVSIIFNEEMLEAIESAIKDPAILQLVLDARLQIYAKQQWGFAVAKQKSLTDFIAKFTISSFTTAAIEGQLLSVPFTVPSPSPALLTAVQQWVLERQAAIAGLLAETLTARLAQLEQQVRSLSFDLEKRPIAPAPLDLTQFMQRIEDENRLAHEYLSSLGIPMGPLSFRIRFAVEKK